MEEKKVGNDNMIFISKCSDPKAVSVLIRGGVEHVVDEAERTLNDALCVVRVLVENPYILGGGGSAEIELSKQLKDFATTIGGREQLAIEAYANSLEVIPKTLAENAGFDPVDLLVEVRAKHDTTNGKSIGVNVNSGKPENMICSKTLRRLMVTLRGLLSTEF